jgi:hypothetical protein
VRIGRLNRSQYPQQGTGPVRLLCDRLIDQQLLMSVQNFMGDTLHDSPLLVDRRSRRTAANLRESGGELKKAFLRAKSVHPPRSSAIELYCVFVSNGLKKSEKDALDTTSNPTAEAVQSPPVRMGAFPSAAHHNPARSTRN